MWRKFREEDSARPGITMAEVFSPMLEPTSLEATISECSLEAKPSDIFTQKLKERLLSCCKSHQIVLTRIVIKKSILMFFSVLGYVMLIMFIPIIIFVLVLEWRRIVLTDPPGAFVANGSFHLAHTSCGPVQG